MASMVSNGSDNVDVAVRPGSGGFVLAHIRELSAKESPNSFTTSTKYMTWHPIPQASAEAHGMPSSENLVAIWSARQGERGPQLVETPLVHVPRCRLEVTSLSEMSPRGGAGGGKIERVALPGDVFRSLLSHSVPPDGATTAPRHFDDDSNWVFSRCLLAEFSGLGEQEANRMSEEGRLCCWASVVAMRDGDQQSWDLGVVVHRVLTHRRSVSGGCRCV